MLAPREAPTADPSHEPLRSLDMRLLESFVILSEELHFTRAARRMHVVQSALSQQIGRLEHHVGVQLFTRTSRSVVLTPAGSELLEHVRPAISQLRDGVAAARSVAANERHVLRVAFLTSFVLHVLPRLVASFSETHPEVGLRVTESTLATQFTDLRSDRIDVAFFYRLPGTAMDESGLETEVLLVTPQYLAVPSDHPYARARSIDLRDVSGETFITPSGTEATGYHAGFVASCRRHGFSPHVGQHANSLSTSLGLVAGGCGISVVPWLAVVEPPEGIAFLEVENEQTETVVARTTRCSCSPVADALIDEVRVLLEELQVLLPPY